MSARPATGPHVAERYPGHAREGVGADAPRGGGPRPTLAWVLSTDVSPLWPSDEAAPSVILGSGC